jgi:hypothetical protein
MRNCCKLRRGAGIALAALAAVALYVACPTDSDPDPKPAPGPEVRAGGLYKGSTAIDLSETEGANVLEKALTWLKTGAEDEAVYSIYLDQDIALTPTQEADPEVNFASDGKFVKAAVVLRSDTLNNKSNVTVKIASDSTLRTLSLASEGNLLIVGNYLNEKLGANQPPITVELERVTLKGLKGGTTNQWALVYVGGRNAALTLKTQARITDNHNKRLNNSPQNGGNGIAGGGEARGGGVLVRGGTVVMENGSSIDNNIAESTDEGQNGFGGGICLLNEGGDPVLHMKGGDIKANQSIGVNMTRGGAIFNSGGKWIMEGGSITQNHVQTSTGNALNGVMGIWTAPVEVRITGGTITNNTSDNGNKLGNAFNGLRIAGGFLTLGGSPKITDSLVMSANTPVYVLKGFNPPTPVPVDFNAGNANAEENINVANWINKDFLKWAPESNAAAADLLPVSKFALNKWILLKTTDPKEQHEIAIGGGITISPISGNIVATAGISEGLYVGTNTTPETLEGTGDIIAKSIAWLTANATDNGVYTIVVGGNITSTGAASAVSAANDATLKVHYSIEPDTVNSANNVTITIKSDATPRTITLSEPGHLFAIGSFFTGDWRNSRHAYVMYKDYAAEARKNISVIFENITLQGFTGNKAALLYIGPSATVTLNNGALVTGNTNTSPEAVGGGILVRKGAVTLNGGSVTNNKAITNAEDQHAFGGGIAFFDGSVATETTTENLLTLKAGSIKGNIAQIQSSSNPNTARGGGVFAFFGRINMTGGEITNNLAENRGIGQARGGAYGDWDAMFLQISGGKIYGNDATASEGKVAIKDMLIRDPAKTVLSGSPEIEAITLQFDANISVAQNFAPAAPVKIHVMPGDGSDGNPALDANRVLLVKSSNYNGAMPVDKFTLGDSISSSNAKTPLTGHSITAEGKYQ